MANNSNSGMAAKEGPPNGPKSKLKKRKPTRKKGRDWLSFLHRKKRKPAKVQAGLYVRYFKYLNPFYWVKRFSHQKLTLDGVSRAQLTQNVPGLGKKTVDGIIEARESGKIHIVDDVVFVDGVGPEAVNELRNYLIDRSRVPDLFRYIVSSVFALATVGAVMWALSLYSSNLVLQAQLVDEKNETLETKTYALAVMRGAIYEKARDQEIISQLILKKTLKDISADDPEKMGLDDVALYKLLVNNYEPVDVRDMDLRIYYDDELKYRNRPVMLVSYEVYSELKKTQVVVDDYEFVFPTVQPTSITKSSKVAYLPVESGTDYFNFILSVAGDGRTCRFYSTEVPE